jgi:glycerol kinase
MGKKFIISIDLGTTGNRVICFDEGGKLVSSAYKEHTQYFPKPGWVEHDPIEIWQAIQKLIPEALKNGSLNSSDAICIGITNQRETTVVWDKETGKPVYNAIVWQCRRTSDYCTKLKEDGHEKLFRETTGLVVDAYFSGTKIKWILENVPGAMERAGSGKILFGTIDTWILWNLTSGAFHLTDFTNASRTLLFDIRKKKWSDEILSILNIPRSLLPEVQSSASDFGSTNNVPGLPDGILIGGIAGDQQSALAGQACVTDGSLKNTYGTGCFMLINNGDHYTLSKNGLLTTLACGNKGEPVYALEGSVFIGGAVIQWLRDYMKFFSNSEESEKAAISANKDSEIVFIPAFTGLGAPYWKTDARGAIFGLTRGTTQEDIIRAALKSIALQSMDVIEAMQLDTGKKIKELRVDGGAVKNGFLMQFQSDILGIPVLVPENNESTALGAAYLAGISFGIYKTIDEIAAGNKISSIYKPLMNEQDRNNQIEIWREAVKRLL